MEIGWGSCIFEATYMQTMLRICSMLLFTEKHERYWSIKCTAHATVSAASSKDRPISNIQRHTWRRQASSMPWRCTSLRYFGLRALPWDRASCWSIMSSTSAASRCGDGGTNSGVEEDGAMTSSHARSSTRAMVIRY